MSEDRALIAVEDFDCWLRLAKANARFRYVDKCLGNYWIGADAISNVSLKNIEAQHLLYSRHHADMHPEFKDSALARHNYLLGTLYLRLNNPTAALKYLLNASPLPNLKFLTKKWAYTAFSLLLIIRNAMN
ncbi:hypothetical protein [Polynucleobacter necessarius]|uniref:hypothetical protein n=1 Tax=Polynucleobacter necessarius TaxID=576610 RepID=UPI001E2D1D0E|nr:hypothetical protein [Polynucleobacter necessarius]